MAVKHDRKRLLKKLKTKIKTLQKKEEQARAKLQVAIKKIRHLAKDYRIKLALKAQVMENQIAEVRKKSYVKIIDELEDMIIKGIKVRGKALTSAIEKMDKKHFTKKPAKRKAKKKSRKKRRR